MFKLLELWMPRALAATVILCLIALSLLGTTAAAIVVYRFAMGTLP
jgi:hypothetical protein